jgi:hypothetical protein
VPPADGGCAHECLIGIATPPLNQRRCTLGVRRDDPVRCSSCRAHGRAGGRLLPRLLPHSALLSFPGASRKRPCAGTSASGPARIRTWDRRIMSPCRFDARSRNPLQPATSRLATNCNELRKERERGDKRVRASVRAFCRRRWQQDRTVTPAGLPKPDSTTSSLAPRIAEPLKGEDAGPGDDSLGRLRLSRRSTIGRVEEFVPRDFNVPRRLETPQFVLEPLGPSTTTRTTTRGPRRSSTSVRRPGGRTAAGRGR